MQLGACQQQKDKQMIDMFQDRRIFSHSKKKPTKNILPQLKYSPTMARKFNDELLIGNANSRVLYNYQPLSNILISKKISPPNPEQTAIVLSKKRPTQVNLHNFKIRKQSAKKVLESLNQPQQEIPHRLNSTSLSHRSRLSNLHPECLAQSSPGSLKNSNKVNELTFLVVRGNNNEDLVRDILLQRKIWKQIKAGEGVPNFKWVFYKDRLNYKKMWNYNKKRVINHFEFNDEISTKDQLVKNLQIYCETKKIQVFSVTPVTFTLDFDDQYCEYNLKQFLAFFMKNDPRKNKKTAWPFGFISKFQNYMAWQNSDIKKKVNILSRPLNTNTYYSENSYLWLLKPTGLNRGRGIQIFDSLQQLEKILLDYMALMNRKNKKEKPSGKSQVIYHDRTIEKGEKDKDLEKTETSKELMTRESPQGQLGASAALPQSKFMCQKFKLNTCSFVIQKYVQKPFLIKDRKFDIRVWALLTGDLNVYFFKEGYIRTSAEIYSTDNIDNYFIHLTNNAIQKHSQNYGQFEDGNQLSFKNLQQFLPEDQVTTIWDRIKEITYMAFSSVKKKINANQRKNCFQLFGFDYFIDNQLKVWLIEVNQNPCLQCSSPLLGQLIPRMINDMFKLTLDRIIDKKIEQKVYPVEGYRDGQNMWEHLGQLMPNSEYSPSKKK